jgi:hypothetical protein
MQNIVNTDKVRLTEMTMAECSAHIYLYYLIDTVKLSETLNKSMQSHVICYSDHIIYLD